MGRRRHASMAWRGEHPLASRAAADCRATPRVVATPPRSSASHDASPSPYPSRLPFLGRRGISYDRAGDFAAAIADFSTAIALLPGHSDFFHNRGFCYRKVRRQPRRKGRPRE